MPSCKGYLSFSFLIYHIEVTILFSVAVTNNFDNICIKRIDVTILFSVAVTNNCDNIKIRSTFILTLLIALFHVAVINNCGVKGEISEIKEAKL
jgi:hypothetical protein